MAEMLSLGAAEQTEAVTRRTQELLIQTLMILVQRGGGAAYIPAETIHLLTDEGLFKRALSIREDDGGAGVWVRIVSKPTGGQ